MEGTGVGCLGERNMQIHESAEDYLESILILGQQKGSVRSIDVAQYLGFSKPSVSRAVNLLRENGYITVDPGGLLKLTKSGLEIADRIYERHQFISAWLISLGVSRETAVRDACRIEHAISAESFAAIKEHFPLED